jgi:cell division septal protein FtsQ
LNWFEFETWFEFDLKSIEKIKVKGNRNSLEKEKLKAAH